MRIVIEGNFSPTGSYGIVNLSLARALAQRGHAVALVGLDVDDARLAELARPPLGHGPSLGIGEPGESPDARIRQVWPPNWARRGPERLIVVQPWEFGSVPLSWLDALAEVDALWVPSEYVKRGYIQSGVDPSKVWVVPNGVDIDDVAPRTRARDETTQLLFVGGTIFRKGIDVLVEALDSLDDATLARTSLVVKDVGAESFYVNQSLLGEAMSSHPRVEAITVVERRHLERRAVLELIANADVLVHPYRAEGFGLPVLEAMALGTPVIHTRGGATNEFCGPDESLLVPSSLHVASSPLVGSWVLADQCYWYEPDVGELGRLLGAVVNGDVATAPLALAATRRAREWSWAGAARAAEAALEGLCAGSRPQDSLTRLVGDVRRVLVDDAPPAPVLTRLAAIGDLGTAWRVARAVERRRDPRERVALADARARLAGLVATTPDVWSGGPYRALSAAHDRERATRSGSFAYAHDFEGDDRATYAIAQYLAEYFGGCHSILDVACGQGSMMRVLRGRGKRARGIEADPTLVAELRADGFTVYEGFVPDVLDGLDVGDIDGVFLGHIVEHLTPDEVERVLAWIYEHLADQGLVVVQTPDFAEPRVSRENFWLDATHRRPYPVRLLKSLLSAAGFVPVEGGCRPVGEVAPLDAMAVARRPARVARGAPTRVRAAPTLRVGHYGLFHGDSGFSQASRTLFDHDALGVAGVDVMEVAVDAPPRARASMTLRDASDAPVDVAVLDVPLGWLDEVSSRVRARYRIARTTFEAAPVPPSLRHVLHGFDEVWCFSHFDADVMAASGVAPERLVVVPPGVEGYEAPSLGRLPSRPGPGPGCRFLSVFHFEPRKNPEALVRAFARVAATSGDSELVLKLSGVSDEGVASWLRATVTPAEMRALTGRLRVITSRLSREALSELYLESDVFVLPTRGEGYGLPFLEALAHGRATICPDVGGHREFCTPQNSLLVRTTAAPASRADSSGVFRESWWREVDDEVLTATMLDAVAHPERLATLGERGWRDAARFSVASVRTRSARRLDDVASLVRESRAG